MKTTTETAAVAEATRLCDRALDAQAKFNQSPVLRARAKRYQVEVFSRTSARTERIVLELLGGTAQTRTDLLVAIGAYCDAGIAEVERRFGMNSAE